MGEEQRRKAVAQASSMKRVFERHLGVKVGIPQKLAEIRLTRIVISVTGAELLAAVIKHGECGEEDARVG